jgi:hypothetical protein
MNDDSFDRLSMTLAGPVSRRRALAVMAGSVAGGALAMAGPSRAQADARCKKVGARCRQDSECCNSSLYYGGGEFCNPQTGRCQCRPDSHLCKQSGQCIPCDPSTSVFNPSTCACDCKEGTTDCGNGVCCASGATCCDGGCCDAGFECCPGSCGVCCPSGECCPTNECACVGGYYC